jgi:hypothetical protein
MEPVLHVVVFSSANTISTIELVPLACSHAVPIT